MDHSEFPRITGIVPHPHFHSLPFWCPRMASIQPLRLYGPLELPRHHFLHLKIPQIAHDAAVPPFNVLVLSTPATLQYYPQMVPPYFVQSIPQVLCNVSFWFVWNHWKRTVHVDGSLLQKYHLGWCTFYLLLQQTFSVLKPNDFLAFFFCNQTPRTSNPFLKPPPCFALSIVPPHL